MNPALKQGWLLPHGEGQLSLAILSSSTFTQKAFVLYWDMPRSCHPGLLWNKPGWTQMIYNEVVDDWNWNCSSDAQHFSNAFLQQPRYEGSNPEDTQEAHQEGPEVRWTRRSTKWARKAAAWRTRPGIWEGSKGLPAPLAAISLETAI